MAAYVIVEIEILDPVGYEEYKKLAGASVERYGGKYIVRGEKTEVLEAIGNRNVLLCLSSNQCSAPKNGLTAKNTGSPAKCVIAPPRQR